VVEEFDDMLGIAHHPDADPNGREYGGYMPSRYSWCVAIDSRVMREQGSGTCDHEGGQAEDGQDKWKRSQPDEDKP